MESSSSVYPFLRVASLSDGNLLVKTLRWKLLAKLFRWKLESLHRQRGLAFLESNAREVLLFLRVTPLSDWSLTRQLGWEDLQSQASIAILKKKELEDWTKGEKGRRVKRGSWGEQSMSNEKVFCGAPVKEI